MFQSCSWKPLLSSYSMPICVCVRIKLYCSGSFLACFFKRLTWGSLFGSNWHEKGFPFVDNTCQETRMKRISFCRPFKVPTCCTPMLHNLLPISLPLYRKTDFKNKKWVCTVPAPLLTAVIIFSHYFMMSAFLWCLAVFLWNCAVTKQVRLILMSG